MTLQNLLKTTRQYFWNLDFDEVEIPYLNSSLPLEPNIYSFKTIWKHSKDKYYLPTSPEFALKKHLVTTKTDCFSIAHCFRDLESEGPHHTKEFLMLEWYEVNKNYLDLMTSVEKYLSNYFDFPTPYPRLSINSFVKKIPSNEPDFNQMFLNNIEPKLPDGPVFLTGYPAYLSPLSYSENNIAHRFELYINGIEIANGCTENRDPIAIKNAFETEKKYRLDHQLPLHPISSEFIDICSQLPPSAGIGLGFSRLSKILASS
jgi:elongation factor P--(R)-beta-lysine ligase